MLVIIGLAILAAMVVGVNIGARNSPPVSNTPISPPPESPTPTPLLLSYSNPLCKVNFIYPDSYNKVDLDNNGGAVFAHKDSASGSLTFLCQKDLPKPKELDNAETIKFGSVSALILIPDATNSAQANGRLFLTHPVSKLIISISGTKEIFETVVDSLVIE